MKEDPPNTILLTRKQAAKEAEQEKLDDEDTANSGVDPVSLDQIYSFEDFLFNEYEEEHDDDNHDQVQGTPDVEEDILQLPPPVPEEGIED